MTIQEIAHEIATQDNLSTNNVYFAVQEKRPTYGVDVEYDPDVVWMDDEGNQATAEESERFEKIYQETYDDECESEDGYMYKRYGVAYHWTTVESFFTRKAALAWIERNKHNYRELQVYGESWCRNPEMRAVRDYLLSLVQP